nr:unnamed protein product [Callosobruchus analis]
MPEQQSLTTLTKNKSNITTKLKSKSSLHKKSILSLRGASAEVFQKSTAKSIQEEEHKLHNERPKIDYKKELVFLFFNRMLDEIIEQRDPVRTAEDEDGIDSFQSEPNSYMILDDEQSAPDK